MIKDANNQFKCDFCKPSFYKDSLYGKCQSCPNYGNDMLNSSASGSTKIDSCYDQSSIIFENPLYYDVLENYQYTLIVFFIFILILFFGLVMKNTFSKRKKFSDPYNFEDATIKFRDIKPITDELKQNRTEFKIVDTLFHRYRINVLGTNEYDNQWQIKSDNFVIENGNIDKESF